MRLLLTVGCVLLGTSACGTMADRRSASRVEYVRVAPRATQPLLHRAPAPPQPPTRSIVRIAPARAVPSGSTVTAETIDRGYLAAVSNRAERAAHDHAHDHDHDHERGAEAQMPSPEGEAPDTPAPGGVDGIVAPYSLRNIFRGFGACRGNRHVHEAIDIGGVGKDYGLGTPIVAMNRSRVTFIGRPEDKPHDFGKPDRRSGSAERGRRMLPRSKHIDGYGKVYFFTRTKGRWRSGTVVVAEGIGGRLDGHRIRYMHLGAVHPDLKIGDVLEAGQELGLMGGTGVQRSSPHVHIDVESPEGERLDVAPLLGLGPTAGVCPRPKKEGREFRVWMKRVASPQCGDTWHRQEDFASGEYYAHDIELTLEAGEKVHAALQRTDGSWQPKIEILDDQGATLHTGLGPTKAGRSAAIAVGRLASGRKGKAAKVSLRARRAGTVIVRVTAWPENASGLLLPRDGSYTLSIEAAGCGR